MASLVSLQTRQHGFFEPVTVPRIHERQEDISFVPSRSARKRLPLVGLRGTISITMLPGAFGSEV